MRLSRYAFECLFLLAIAELTRTYVCTERLTRFPPPSVCKLDTEAMRHGSCTPGDCVRTVSLEGLCIDHRLREPCESSSRSPSRIA